MWNYALVILMQFYEQKNGFCPWEEHYQLHLDLEYGSVGGPESKCELFKDISIYIFHDSSWTITSTHVEMICGLSQ